MELQVQRNLWEGKRGGAKGSPEVSSLWEHPLILGQVCMWRENGQGCVQLAWGAASLLGLPIKE